MAQRRQDPLTTVSFEPGELRHRVTIQGMSTTSGIAGASVTWSDLMTVYARMMPERGTDVMREGQTVAETQVPCMVRYRPGLAANMRLLFNGSTYVIRSITNVLEQNTKLVLWCVALGDEQ